MLTQHTIEEDFEHFLSYSGLHSESSEVKEKLLKAYEANWEADQQVKAVIENGCNGVDELSVCHACNGTGYTA